VPVPGKPGVEIKQVKDNRVEVRHNKTGDLLAWCYIGDDETLETIADLLSAKGLPQAAEKLRQMGMDARRQPGPGFTVRLRG
jgi:hypothetical protein